MAKNTKHACYELFLNAPILARKAIIKAYQKTRNISEMATLFKTTRKTGRSVMWR